MTLLSDYEQQVADLLHDPNQAKWTLVQLDRYINEARKQLVMDTGCLRVLQPAYLTGGTEQYTFGQVTGGVILAGGSNYSNPTIAFSGGGGSGVAAVLTQSGGAVNTITFTSFGSGYTSTPSFVISDPTGSGASIAIGIVTFNTFDVLDVHVLWGTQRYTLDWKPFRWFSAWFRQWTSAAYQRQPVCWSAYGDNSFFIGPPPDQSYPIEVDSIVLPTPLTDYVTTDPVPAVAQDPVKFYAAYLAKYNSQAYGEAETFLAQYRRRLLEVTSSYTGRIASQYGTQANP